MNDSKKLLIWLAVIAFVLVAYAVSWVSNGGKTDKVTPQENEICLLQKEVLNQSYLDCRRRYETDGK